MAIVYRHRRLDNNEVFYIGIGKEEKRAYVKTQRSVYWKNIVKRYGHTVEILANDLSYDDAKELEMFLISEYGRKDLGTGQLVNMTGGGDGTTDISLEHRKKISKANKGKIISDETKLKMSISMKGIKRSDKAKENIRVSKTGIKYSKETNLKKGKSGGENNKAKTITYFGEDFDCIKDLYNKYFSDKMHYGTLTNKIKNNKLKTK